MSDEQRVAWHSEGELWEEFVRWSRDNCSPTGAGHLVPWYWDIWRGAAAAKDRMRNREGPSSQQLAFQEQTIETLEGHLRNIHLALNNHEFGLARNIAESWAKQP